MPDKLQNRADFEHLINGYDGAIAYLDEQLGHVFDMLKAQSIWDETAIIISADHGEAFGELGQYMEHGSAAPAVHHIPLIIKWLIKWPGITDSREGQSRDELLLNLDLTATVADGLGLTVPKGWNGQSFLPLLRGENLENPRQQLVWSHGLHTRQRAVFDGKWCFIRTYEPSYYEYPPRMLFDLENDPHTDNDLAPEEPERVVQMESDLLAWENGHVAATNLPDPMRQIEQIPVNVLGGVHAHLRVLESEGRIEDAERLRQTRSRVTTDYMAPTLVAHVR